MIPILIVRSLLAIGEELGWRGWLSTRTSSWSFPAAAVTVSLAWAVWHLPVVVAIEGVSARTAYVLTILSWGPFLLALRRK